MPTSAEYGKLAEECYRLATEAKTETDRLACLELAQSWLEAASREEGMAPEQIAEEQKLAHSWMPDETPQPKVLSGFWRRMLAFFR